MVLFTAQKKPIYCSVNSLGVAWGWLMYKDLRRTKINVRKKCIRYRNEAGIIPYLRSSFLVWKENTVSLQNFRLLDITRHEFMNLFLLKMNSMITRCALISIMIMYEYSVTGKYYYYNYFQNFLIRNYVIVSV